MPQVVTDILNEGVAKDQLWWNPKVFNIPDIKPNASWVGKNVTWIKPGDTIPLNWSHEASEKLGKVKKGKGKGKKKKKDTDKESSSDF